MTNHTKPWLKEYLTKPVDKKGIINQTRDVFVKSRAFEKIRDYERISEKDFDFLHKSFLTPTKLTISLDNFHKEIADFQPYFEPWGIDSTDESRQGISLVNTDGVLKQQDPINGSLMEYNSATRYPLLEVDCKETTSLFDINSMSSLKKLDGTWYRSNILKWKEKAKFVPHIDSLKPAYWIRLWGVDNPDNIILRYYENGMKVVKNIEPGRIYIIDTTLVHDAIGLGECYQWFLSVAPDQIETLKRLL